jgi:hypothetical protein
MHERGEFNMSFLKQLLAISAALLLLSTLAYGQSDNSAAIITVFDPEALEPYEVFNPCTLETLTVNGTRYQRFIIVNAGNGTSLHFQTLEVITATFGSKTYTGRTRLTSSAIAEGASSVETDVVDTRLVSESGDVLILRNIFHLVIVNGDVTIRRDTPSVICN